MQRRVRYRCYRCLDLGGYPLTVERKVPEGGSRFPVTSSCSHGRPIWCVDLLLALM